MRINCDRNGNIWGNTEKQSSPKAARWAAPSLSLFFIPVSEIMLSGELDNTFPLPLLASSDGRAGSHSEGDLAACAAWEQALLSRGTAVLQSTCRILMRLSRLFIQHRSLLWIQISGCIQLNINVSALPKSPVVIVPASVFLYSFSCAFPLPLLEEQRKVPWERIFFNRQNGTNWRNLSFECLKAVFIAFHRIWQNVLTYG